MTWRDQDVLIKDKWEDKKDGGQLFPSVQPVVWIKAKQGGGGCYKTNVSRTARESELVNQHTLKFMTANASRYPANSPHCWDCMQ